MGKVLEVARNLYVLKLTLPIVGLETNLGYVLEMSVFKLAPRLVARYFVKSAEKFDKSELYANVVGKRLSAFAIVKQIPASVVLETIILSSGSFAKA